MAERKSIHLVDSPSSPEFSQLFFALERAYIVAMDAEWKPLRKGAQKTPRVSILQLALRLRREGDNGKTNPAAAIPFEDGDKEEDGRIDGEMNCIDRSAVPFDEEEEEEEEDGGKMNTVARVDVPSEEEEDEEGGIDGEMNRFARAAVPFDEEEEEEGGGKMNTIAQAAIPSEEEEEGIEDGKMISRRSPNSVLESEEEKKMKPDEDEDGKEQDDRKMNPVLRAVIPFEEEEEGGGGGIQNQKSISRENPNSVSGSEEEKNKPGKDKSEKINFDSHGAGRKPVSGRRKDKEELPPFKEGMEYAETEDDVVFILDLLALPPWSFWEAMKKMLTSPSVLKLGFRFRQDLFNLAASFPGPDAHGCFAKVDPYVDVSKLYYELQGGISSAPQANEKQMPAESLSLVLICEEVLGLILNKDLQCSNWEQRPLTVEQVTYAAMDAHCLLAMYDVLEAETSKQSLRGGKVGLAEVLLYEERGFGLVACDAPRSIMRPQRGSAVCMARELALTDNIVKIHGCKASHCFSHFHLGLARRFGERLLTSSAESKSVRRKPRSRRGRIALGKSKGESADILEWQGPPPWDVSWGGDGEPKFLCDVMVEGLARQLRNVGIDTECPHVRKADARFLLDQAEKEGRVLLTRDTKLMKRQLFPRNFAYFVKCLGKKDQLTEVIKAFHLTIEEDQLLSRCNKCNGEFIPEPIQVKDVLNVTPVGQKIPQYALEEGLTFWQCSVCKHMYWQGGQFLRALQCFQELARRMHEQM